MFDLICDTRTCDRYFVDDPDEFEGEPFCPKCHHGLRFQSVEFRVAAEQVWNEGQIEAYYEAVERQSRADRDYIASRPSR